MKNILFLYCVLLTSLLNAQQHLTVISNAYSYQNYFEEAYLNYPDVPRGILEAVAWSNTRITHLTQLEEESCIEIPKAYGVMGLTLDGKNYFKNNLIFIAQLSGISSNAIIESPKQNILAYAKTYHLLLEQFRYEERYDEPINGFNLELHGKIIKTLSEIPDSGLINNYAKDAQLFQIFSFLQKPEYSNYYSFPNYTLEVENYFGSNYDVLNADKIILETNGIRTEDGTNYTSTETNVRSTEYGPALWNPAASCNYSSRSGVAVSAITIHTVQGTYAGCISWFQNCNASVSAHYVIRSSDGQVTQMVLESSKAWHVGSANPYTIGYEHEGYVSNAAWYTTAMYNSSANLTKDVCNSGYGINPLRAYFGPASSGTNTLGNCTRIKGHQHYASQTHTDPGINWNWEYYYQLINNNPSVTTLTNVSGSFYDSGGASGDYNDDERYLTLFTIPGATSITLNFSSFNIEANWDYLYVYDGATISAPLIGVYTGTNSPGSITSSGGSLLVEFRSDCSTTAPGWAANWTSNAIPPPPSDNIAPTTLVNTPGNWITQNFTASFTDNDNVGGSGLEKSYYQVIDYDGMDWRANADKGFFSDNFDLGTIHPEWTNMSGNWQISNGYLVQDDENNGNSNLYAYIDHSLSNRYLYHWSGKIEGAGTNRRAGFHYFCDDPTQSNRNNSYFIWYRLDTDKVQLYKVTNDVFVLIDEVDFDFNVSQWYDFKVIYDRITGKHSVYIDNSLVQTYTDSNPYSGGDYISFRNGNSIYTVNNLKIYRSRNSSVNVEVGITGDLRYQNTNPTTFAGKIKSIVADSSGNLSAIHSQDVNVDWTTPSVPTTINDGAGIDIDTTYNNTELKANWSTSFDQHSDILRYYYAVGTSAGATDVINWTDNYWNDTVHVTGLNLNYGTIYYFSVRAENGAGLLSGIISSDGQQLLTPSQAPVAHYINSSTFICENDSISFQNNSTNAVSYLWTFTGGSPSSSTLASPKVNFPSSGNYTVSLIANGPGGADTLTQQIYVDVSELILADFTVSDTLVYLPNAFVGFTNQSQNANGYNWNFGDGSGSNGTSPWHQYTTQGVYSVMMIAVNNACPADTAYQTVTVQNANNVVNESLSNSVKLINNANSIQLTLNTSTQEEFNFTIYDYSGKLVSTLNKELIKGENSITIETTQFAEAIYILRISSEKTGNCVKSFTIIR